jgi:hypothetical protein
VDDFVFQFTDVGPTGLDKCRRHLGATLYAQEEGALFGLLELSLFERGLDPKAFHVRCDQYAFSRFLPDLLFGRINAWVFQQPPVSAMALEENAEV